jgi:TPR repeat protein
MTRRIAQLLSVAVLLVALSVPLVAQSRNTELDDLRAMAEAGRVTAQFRLALRYSVGRRGSGLDPNERLKSPVQDYTEAVRWYRLAAEQGHAQAQNNLGDLYRNGLGVPQDDMTAHMWFNLAASRLTGGARDIAVNNRDRTEDRLSPEQRVEAQRLAREWDEAHPRD